MLAELGLHNPNIRSLQRLLDLRMRQERGFGPSNGNLLHLLLIRNVTSKPKPCDMNYKGCKLIIEGSWNTKLHFLRF